MRILPLLLLAAACRQPVDDDTSTPVDADGDGIPAGEDCNDADAAVFPEADELCNGIDDDCDGEIDVGASNETPYYADADADGHGDPSVAVSACDAPDGYTAASGDCDDDDDAVHPGASETDCTDPKDYNCDGSSGYADADADGSPACEDCADDDGTRNPSATEACNAVDDDCDGETDEAGATGESTFYADADGDGFGDAAVSLTACEAPSGHVTDATDCDDAAASTNPSAAEACGGGDEDCDGETDEAGATGESTFYADADADGYGDATTSVAACAQPTGHVSDATDCDDAAGASHPGATEACGGGDEDCDGETDEAGASGEATWYADADGDAHGDADVTVTACAAPTGHVASSDDCADDDAARYPGAAEACDGSDADCDGDVDNDGDGDGAPAESCGGTDCDDASEAFGPSAPEGCDGEDHDCDGEVDSDADGDGFADATCGGDDCNDDDDTRYPEGGVCAAGGSCKELVGTGVDSGDGAYTIDPDGVGGDVAPLEAWCDMSTEGGGWTLIMRAYDADFHYDHAVWTTTALENESELGFTTAGRSKYPAFNVVPFTELRTSYPDDLSNGFTQAVGPQKSALGLFLTPGKTLGSHVAYFNTMMSAFSQEWGCTSYRDYGLNQKDYLGTAFISGGSYCDWNGGARWGQRVNANHSNTGNHAGQGWGTYSTISYDDQRKIRQLLWVR